MNRKLEANARIEGLLKELDAAVAALQRRHELYFLGIDRKEPREDRDLIKQQIQALKRENVRNTALKFRLNSLWNKFLAYERMWLRTIVEIEEGRYHRDVFKAKMRASREQQRELEELAETQQKGVAAAEALRDEARGGARKRPSRPTSEGGGSISDAKLEALYSAFVTAKKRCKEDTSGISMEAMRKSLNKQIPAIKAKHGAKAVDFKVVIKGGKAVLKAVPRTG
ncbi:MAG: hypothetical protein P1V51_15775 [Deltaproteobacteria bacterium]|nr:hypothetical protein [Deltaproteobacteria bacterium]